MLVVGRRGLGSVGRLLIGSTSDEVANLADVPVVVVPDWWKPPVFRTPVVVGVDDNDDNVTAIEFAVTAAAVREAPVRMVYVWDLPRIYSWDAMTIVGVEDEWTAKAVERLEGIRRARGAGGHPLISWTAR